MKHMDQRIIDALATAAVEYEEPALAMDSTFREIGIDSLDVMSLFLAIEERFEIKFSEDEANAIRTPADLVVTLDRKLS